MSTDLIKYVYIVTNDDHDQNISKMGYKMGPVVFGREITVMQTLESAT